MKIVALAGGVGGAKLVGGFAQLLAAEDLTAIVNTGDDFHHWGLKICPDLDTVCYSVAGLANPETGWGRRDESWNVLSEVTRLQGEDWFRLGDRDLATHLERTERLASGQTLTQVTQSFCRSWGITCTILPMSDDPIATLVDTQDHGEMAFQEYFVHRKSEPRTKGFRFVGIEYSRPSPGVLESIASADAVVLCPSNPWVSLDPILSVPGILPSVKKKNVVACVSPIVGGKAIKGPAAKMFHEMGIEPSALAVARHYQGTISHFIFDDQDKSLEPAISNLDMNSFTTDTIMNSEADRRRVATDVLNFIKRSS